MIGYVTLGTNDLAKACAFYDALLSPLSAKRLMEEDHFVGWGTAMDKPMLAIFIPENKQPASVGNGVMVALQLDAQEQVKSIHERALELGGTSEGDPGPRGSGFYAAYFRDLDGNKLAAFSIG